MITVEKLEKGTYFDDAFKISFRYDPTTVAKVKELAERRYLPEDRAWEIPAHELPALIEKVGLKVTTVEKFASTLRDNAGEDPVVALAIVDQSIDKGWKDLYPLKNYGRQGKPTAVSKKFSGNTLKDAEGKDIVF